ncbi:MAG: purine-nucleoside phosphorylase [Myxococcota bacterium]
MLETIDAVVARMRDRFGDPPPEIAVVLGSGLGYFAQTLADRVAVPYPEVGHPAWGVPGHAGELVVGTVAGRRVAVLSGRLHLYEGHDPATVVLGVRALARWGATGLVLTTAVGGVAPELRPGEVMLVTDHVNLSGANPLRGPNIDALGPRFPDLQQLYAARLRDLAREVTGEPLREGVYVAMPGPSYETPAEIRMIARLGGDVVGMSLVHEAIAASHAGMEVLGVAVVSNPAAGLAQAILAHADVTAVMQAAGEGVAQLLRGVIARW